MTWGALNNYREKTASEPLPDFLTGQENKGLKDNRQDPQFQSVDEVIVHKTDRSQGGRKEPTRGYGMAYPKAINIQMSKKTLWASLVFFATIIVLTFCIGYLVGNMAVALTASETNTTTVAAPTKKPIIPARKKVKKETVKHEVETKAPVVLPEAEDSDFLLSEEDTSTVSTENKNNKDTNSELLYKAAPPAEDADDMDD